MTHEDQTAIADALIIVAEAGFEVARALNNVASAIAAHGARAPVVASALRNLDEERPAAEATEGEGLTWDKRPGIF